MADAHRLLSDIADALNACERARILTDPDHGAVMTRLGYVLAGGDPRLGSRWIVRMKTELPAAEVQGIESQNSASDVPSGLT